MQKSALVLRIFTLVFSFISGGHLFGQGIMGEGSSSSALNIPNRPLPPLDKTDLGEISYFDITQELLDSLRSRYRLQKTPYYKVKMSIGNFSESGVLRQQVYLRFGSVKANDEVFRMKRNLVKGKLIAVDSHGVYLYQKSAKKMGFVPYTDIWYIRRGNTSSDKIVRDASAIIGTTTLIGMGAGIAEGEIDYVPLGVIIGGLFGAFLSPIVIVPDLIYHELQNTSKRIKFRINYRSDKMTDYIAMVEKDRYRYGKRIMYHEFPGSSNPRINQDEPVISDQPSAVSQDAAISDQPSANSQEPMAKDQDPIAKDQDPIAKDQDPIAKDQQTIVLPSFKSGKYISAAWMVQGFESKFVNVQRMLKTFPDLRNSQLTDSDKALFKNSDEVKYAAMLICTPLGFDFSKAVELDESQANDLSQLLPYFNVQIVNGQTVIKSSALTRIDEVNLEFLYKLMQ
ncbi:MAG: hypothetical protein NBV77_03040 [Bacteroidia bacterium]|nr:hypothetical protein [Bacteroidia bacterium]